MYFLAFSWDKVKMSGVLKVSVLAGPNNSHGKDSWHVFINRVDHTASRPGHLTNLTPTLVSLICSRLKTDCCYMTDLGFLTLELLSRVATQIVRLLWEYKTETIVHRYLTFQMAVLLLHPVHFRSVVCEPDELRCSHTVRKMTQFYF